MRVAVALLCLIVIIVGTTADSTKDEKSGISRVMRGVRNGNSAKKKPQEKVGGKRTRKPRRKIKSKGRKVGSKRPGNRRGGKRGGKRSNKNPGRKAAAKKSTKKRGKVSKSKSVKKTNRGNQPRTSGTSRQALKGNDCDYIDLGAITTAGTGCATNGVKFVIKGNSGVRKQFLYVDGKVIIALTKLKFAECTAFTDITSQVNCKAVAGLDVVSLVGTNTPATPGATTSSSSSGFDAVLLIGGLTFETYPTNTVFMKGNCPGVATNNIINDFFSRATALLNNEIYICGGKRNEVEAQGSCHVRDLESGSEVLANSMNKPRFSFTMNTVGSKLVAVGGGDAFSVSIGTDYPDTYEYFYLDTVEVLESGSNWELLDFVISPPRADHCAVTVSSRSIVLIGGLISDGVSVIVSSATEELDIITGNMLKLADTPKSFVYGACCLYQNKIMISGGLFGYIGSNQVSTLDFRTSGSTWKTENPLSTLRVAHVMYVVKGVATVYSGSVENGAVIHSEQLVNGVWVKGKDSDSARLFPGSVGLLC